MIIRIIIPAVNVTCAWRVTSHWKQSLNTIISMLYRCNRSLTGIRSLSSNHGHIPIRVLEGSSNSNLPEISPRVSSPSLTNQLELPRI
jgi:hypothetical protein